MSKRVRLILIYNNKKLPLTVVILGLGGCPRIVVVARGSHFEVDFLII